MITCAKCSGAITRDGTDLANHVLSCGIDFYWRARAADIVASWRPGKIADLATGTGDLALALQKKLPDAEITGVDFLPEMLELARRKGVQHVVLADAMRLPFADGSFDCVTIAFGLRNLENYSAALAEICRVLNTNGHLLVLEFSLPSIPILRAAYRFYLHRCLPLIGSCLTQTRSAYRLPWQVNRTISKWQRHVRVNASKGIRFTELQTFNWRHRNDLYCRKALGCAARSLKEGKVPCHSRKRELQKSSCD